MNKQEINQILADRYGLDVSTGKPRYRIVFSSEETEKRVGKFDEYEDGVFIRTVSGVRDWPKYSYMEPRWVLEILIPIHNPELTERINYEPLYVFQDKNGNYLPLNLDVCDIVINTIQTRKEQKPRSELSDLAIEEELRLKEQKQFRQHLDDVGTTDFTRKLAQKELILSPGFSEPVKETEK